MTRAAWERAVIEAALAYHADCVAQAGVSPTLEKRLTDAAYNHREPFDPERVAPDNIDAMGAIYGLR